MKINSFIFLPHFQRFNHQKISEVVIIKGLTYTYFLLFCSIYIFINKFFLINYGMSMLKVNQYMTYFRILLGIGSVYLFIRLLKHFTITQSLLILIGVNFVVALPVEIWYWRKTGLADMMLAQRIILVNQWRNVKKAWHERKLAKKGK